MRRRNAILEVTPVEVGHAEARSVRRVVSAQMLRQRVSHHFIHVDGDPRPALEMSVAPVVNHFQDGDRRHKDHDSNVCDDDRRRAVQDAVGEPQAGAGQQQCQHASCEIAAALPADLQHLR